MDKNTNLDELYPGMENLYTELCNKYGEDHERDKNNLKIKYIIVISVAVIIILFAVLNNLNSIIGTVIICTVFICFLIPVNSNNKVSIEAVAEIENIILKHINTTIVREKNCDKNHGMKLEYDEADVYKLKYNRYVYDNYYTYKLINDTTVENVHLLVQGSIPRSNAISTIFNGQFIKIKNKYNFKSRIDILKDKKSDKLYDILEQKNTFKRSDLILDNVAFENTYKVFCDDKDYAYQFFTPDVMELLLEYREKMDVGFDITLVDDNIYIKIDEQLINLYSNPLNNPLKRSTVEYFVKKIKYSMDFIEILLNKINEKNMY